MRRALATLLLSASSMASAQTDAQLRYACRDFVMQALHDPRGAELRWTEGTVRRAPDGTHIVEFPGRATNEYGALRRQVFRCVIRHDGGDGFTAVRIQARDQR